MKTIALLLLATSASAHGGPDGGFHHALPLLPSIIMFMRFCYYKMKGGA